MTLVKCVIFSKCHAAGITIMSIECRSRQKICIWQKR